MSANRHDDGWLILFFGAGLYLSNDDDFPWPEMAGFLAGLDPRLKELLAIYRVSGRNERVEYPRRETEVRGRMNNLDRERIVLDQIAQLGVPVFADTSDSLVISGECYSYEFDRLSASQEPWHWTLMRGALIALATLRPKMPVLAAYEFRGGLVRLFLCAKKDLRMKRGTHALLASVPGYVECGRDALSVTHMRLESTFYYTVTSVQ